MKVEISQDLDDAARLAFMDEPTITLLPLVRALRSEGREVSALQAAEIWARYRGYDGRTFPTHDVETGRRLR